MKNYELVEQWAATIQAEPAYNELLDLKVKYPWMKCEKSLETIKKLYNDLPKIMMIIKHQEKQNAIHRKYIEVNGLSDSAIIEAIVKQYKL
jgi:hypothetical protein